MGDYNYVTLRIEMHLELRILSNKYFHVITSVLLVQNYHQYIMTLLDIDRQDILPGGK